MFRCLTNMFMSSKIKQKKVCLRWLNGKNCPFTAERCIFMHSKDYEPLCQDWVEGKCIGGKGNSCSSRHYYLETDQNMNHQNKEPNTPTTTTPMDTFSSPLVVRNIKETKKLRKIHVDLDTGLEKSFTEEIVEDIVDLTGQVTPARPTKIKKANLENIDPKKVREKSQKTGEQSEKPAKTGKQPGKPAKIGEQPEKPAKTGEQPEKPAKTREQSEKPAKTREQPEKPAKTASPMKTKIKDNECKYCNKEFKGTIGLKSHLSRNKVCSEKWKLEQKIQEKPQPQRTNLRRSARFSRSPGPEVSCDPEFSGMLTSTPAISRLTKDCGSFNSPASPSIDSLLGATTPLPGGQSPSIIEISDTITGDNTITID